MSKKITEILESMYLRCQENNNSTKNKVLMCKHAQLLSRVRLFSTPGTVALQAPESMRFFWQEYWNSCQFLLQSSDMRL